MPTCKNCQSPFPIKPIIDGKRRNFVNRQYCLVCSPFGSHNTKKIHIAKSRESRTCVCCDKEFKPNRSKGHSGDRCGSCIVSQRRKKLKQEMVELKGGCCVKCGYDKCIEALHFHHRDPSKKEFHIRYAMNRDRQTLINEIEKCDLLCANCHAEAHAAWLIANAPIKRK